MSTNPNKLDWKIAATVGAIAGVGIGGFAFASPENDWFPTPEGVILQDNATSAPRLSAPVVVPTTVKQLASAASVTIPAPAPVPAPVAELSAPSPVPPAPIPADPAPVAAVAPDPPIALPAVVEPPPAALDVDSPMSVVSVASPVSPMSPVSVPSPASPVSPASPGSGADS